MVEQFSQQAPDYQDLLAELLSGLQQIAIAQALPGAVDENLEEREAILDLAGRMAAEDVQLYYQIGLIGRRDLQLSPDQRGGLEMILLRMLAFRPVNAQTTDVGTRSPAPVVAPEQATATAPQAAPSQAAPPPMPAAAADDDWRTLVESMQLKGVVRELAMNCAIGQRDAGHWALVLDASHRQLLNKTRLQRLQDALSACLQTQVQLEIDVAGEAGDTPAQQQRAELEMRQAAAVDTIQSDPNVKAIQKAFDATLHTDSIRPLDN